MLSLSDRTFNGEGFKQLGNYYAFNVFKITKS